MADQFQISSCVSHGDSEMEDNTFPGMVPSSSSPSPYNYESCESYHVFINYKGSDVKMSLANVLYYYLQHLGLRVLMGMSELSCGNLFSVIIERAVRTAAIHVAIFSPQYAYSPWCLAELSLMLKINAKIIPVFYNVRPSDLRYVNKGIYADAFLKYEEERTYLDKLEEWKDALHKASFYSGIEFKTDNDLGILCNNVVDTVLKELKNVKQSCKLEVAEYPVGLDEEVKQLEITISQTLQNNNKNTVKGTIIGIVGTVGVGKTALAKEFYNRKHSSFSRSSFLLDISEAHANGRMAKQQTKLLCDLRIAVPPSARRFRSRGGKEIMGADMIKSQLESWYSEPFIVLDGIDHVEQLDALAVNEFLKYGAFIIVTSRDASLLQSFGISSIHRVKELERNNARELFCWHSFHQSYPLNGFEKLVEDFLNSSAGLPSTLKVLGKHVYCLHNGINSSQFGT